MSNYYEKRDARVALSKILKMSGFTLYGYKPDRSDSMTDYFDPADWDGIAVKGDYIAVVDNKNKDGFTAILNSSELSKYNSERSTINFKTRKKIDKLQVLADRTDFEGEKTTALQKIKQILKNIENNDVGKVEAIKKYINFPKTNYMFFIWDTRSQSILYKQNSLTDWNLDEINYFDHYFKLENRKLVDIFNYNRTTRSEEGKAKIRAKLQKVKEKVENLFEILDNLDNQKKCFKYTEVNSKNKELKFEKISINDVSELNENIYVDSWNGEKYRFSNIKKDMDYTGKYRNYLIFNKVKKNGELYSKTRPQCLREDSLKGKEFYKGILTKPYKWKVAERITTIK